MSYSPSLHPKIQSVRDHVTRLHCTSPIASTFCVSLFRFRTGTIPNPGATRYGESRKNNENKVKRHHSVACRGFGPCRLTATRRSRSRATNRCKVGCNHDKYLPPPAPNNTNRPPTQPCDKAAPKVLLHWHPPQDRSQSSKPTQTQ